MSIPTYRSGWDHTYNAPKTNSNSQYQNHQFSTNPPEKEETYSLSTTSNVRTDQTDQTDQTTTIPPNQQNYLQRLDNNDSLYQYSIVEENTVMVQKKTALQILLSEIRLLRVAGEITEVEEAELIELSLHSYEQVKEAIRYHSL